MSDGMYVPTDVSFGRRYTEMVIRLYGRMVQINRPSLRAPNNAGGVTRVGNAQSFPAKRRWFSSQGRERFEQESGVGVGTELRHYIIGTYDDDIQTGDWFISPVDGRKFVIQYVYEDRTTETRANIEPVA